MRSTPPRSGALRLAGHALLCLALIAAGLDIVGALASEPSEALACRERAEQHLLAGRIAEALADYRALLAEDAEDAIAAQGIVRTLLASDRWREALVEATRLHAALPKSAVVREALGAAQLRAGLPEDALASLEPLAALENPPPRALIALARLHVARGDGARAAELFDRALALAPRDRNVLRAAAEGAPTRAAAIERLARYLELSDGDHPDRIESARNTLRIWRELGERPVWVPTRRPERMEIPLRLVWDRGGRLIGYVIEVRMGGKKKPVRLLLDSGSTGLFLLERVARKRGMQPLAQETIFGGGGKRRHRSNRGLLSKLDLGELQFTDAMVSTTRRELDPLGRFQGVIGLFVFQGYRVTLDLAAGKLVLESSATSESLADASDYWMFSGQMLVRAGSTGGASGMFLFDTGASWSVLSTSFVSEIEEADVGRESYVRGFGGRVEGARLVSGVQLRFQNLESADGPLNAVDLSVSSRLGGVEIAGYIGLDLLAASRIVIDTAARRVRVLPAAPR